MQNRLILWNNDNEAIKGTSEAEGYLGFVELNSISYATTANIEQGQTTGTTQQSAISITLAHGPWVADFQQRLYHGKTLGTVTLTEIELEVGTGRGRTWKKVREITLTEAWMESMSHSWSGIHSSVSFSVEYTGFTLTHSDKVANFNRSERA